MSNNDDGLHFFALKREENVGLQEENIGKELPF